MKYITVLALASGLLLSACGGGGSGNDSGSGGSDGQTLEVAVTFPRVTLPLFQPAQLRPTLSGFEGHTPSCALVSGQVPPGLQLDGNCTVAGTPTQEGGYTFTVRVSASGVRNTLDFPVSMGVQGPGIQYEFSPDAKPVGTRVSSTPSLSWWPAPPAGASWNYVVVSGALAPGLALDPASGAISGTLTTAGAFTAQIGATLTTPLGIYQTASTPYAAAADVPTFSYPTLITQNASGDSILYLGLPAALTPRTDFANTLGDFSLVSGTLPPGLALDAATGVISGTPAAVAASAGFEMEATVTKAGVGNRVRAGSRYEVREPGRMLYPNGISVRVDATFNSISPVWQDDAGVFAQFLDVRSTFAPKPGSCTLPAGVTASANGFVDGHPTETGTFQCTIMVTYSASGAQWTGEAVLNLKVE